MEAWVFCVPGGEYLDVGGFSLRYCLFVMIRLLFVAVGVLLFFLIAGGGPVVRVEINDVERTRGSSMLVKLGFTPAPARPTHTHTTTTTTCMFPYDFLC